jgi:16S rRNA (cytidine1402-2'-O)-methyltransferase
MPGTLYVVGTPIGNLEDITFRAVRVLSGVELIAAEDTRRAHILLAHYQIATRTLSYFKGNEARRSRILLERLQRGGAVALISEAGMPGISDPGARLIALCREKDIPLEVIPGPNAALTALLLSGLSSDRFVFLGFLPRRTSGKQRILDGLRAEPGTLIFYEAPSRVADTLSELREVLGNRPGAIAREMTKLHQEVIRGTLADLAAHCTQTPVRGEVTLVVGGAATCNDRAETDTADLLRMVEERLAQGERPRDIARALARYGRRRVYQLALEHT